MFDARKPDAVKSQAKPATVNQRSSKANHLQARLHIGKPNDRYEQEANQAADRVVNHTNTTKPAVQKMEDEEIQTQAVSTIQRQPEQEIQSGTQTLVQGEEKIAVQMKAEQADRSAPEQLGRQIEQSRGAGSPLSQPIRQQMESGIGADFSKVRIHTGSNAQKLNDQLNANAFTVGNDIFFNRDKYNPDSYKGKHLLAHELTHAVQQNTGNKRIQRDFRLEGKGIMSHYVYDFTIGNSMSEDIPIRVAQKAQEIIKDGAPNTAQLIELKNLAMRDSNSLNEIVRLFMAGLLHKSTRESFKEVKIVSGTKFTFPVSSMYGNLNTIRNLNKEVKTDTLKTMDKKMGYLYERRGHQKAQEFYEEQYQAAYEEEMMKLATEEYQIHISETIAFAIKNDVDVVEVYLAMLNGSSDNTPIDRVQAALVFVVLKAEGLSISDEIISGKIKVDGINTDHFAAIYGHATQAGYSPMAGGGIQKNKGDTIYLKNDTSIYNLAHRSSVIHEMIHTEQDKNIMDDRKKLPTVDAEVSAYQAQAKYVLKEIMSSTGYEKKAAIEDLQSGWSEILMYSILYVSLKNRRESGSSVRMILRQHVKPTSQIRELMKMHQGPLMENIRESIVRQYKISSEAKNEEFEMDGLNGDSILDWLK